MKQRITYVVTNPESFAPEQLSVTNSYDQDVLGVKGVRAAKEHRFTFGLYELPRELSTALQQWHELHIRWASSTAYISTAPFTSRVSPGLHIFFTPLKTTSQDTLCTQLHSLIEPDLKCSSNETSIKMPILSERFSMSASSQYYSFLPSISKTVNSLSDLVCQGWDAACEILFTGTKAAAYMDVDYDTITRALVVNVGWPSSPEGGSWDEKIYRNEKDATIEIGVLTHETNPDPEDIQFGGFLTVLGQDASPSIYLFIDKYQFADPLFLASKNLISLRSLAGATDLEAPDWVVPEWGSAALFELAHPTDPETAQQGQWNVSIPLHLRYLPASNSSHTRVPVPWPVVFWACRADEGVKMAANPFDRVHLGYEALFGPKTRFMHVEPKASGGELVEWIDVPVLDLRKTGWVEMGTVGTVVVAFLGLCWVLLRGGKVRGKVEKGKKKQ
ncbi:PIG-X-domain-containing protein [Setomelanomma holmii]|uniref:Protein PBN1 n=1 Tax=Setomelanomma holmii TaxID=210430 RepID=A0A9P4LIC6_9PLEO|nr:PIG-X-domain-containing protein [Setomelanomma holmii]